MTWQAFDLVCGSCRRAREIVRQNLSVPVWHVLYRSRSHMAVRSVPTRLTKVAFFFGLSSPCPIVLGSYITTCRQRNRQQCCRDSQASFTRQWALQIWTWLQVSGFNYHKLRLLIKENLSPDLPKERCSGILLQGNPVTPHRGTMVSRPLTNGTPMRAGDREAIKTIKLLNSDQYISRSPFNTGFIVPLADSLEEIALLHHHTCTVHAPRFLAIRTRCSMTSSFLSPRRRLIAVLLLQTGGNRSSSKGSSDWSHIATINRTVGLLLLLVHTTLWVCGVLSHWCTLILKGYSHRASRQVVFQLPLPSSPPLSPQ